MSEPITEEELQAAEQRWDDEIGCWPEAIGAHFDIGNHRIVVCLKTGLDLLLNPKLFRGFENASDAVLSRVEIEASGYALYFPLMDEGIWLPNTYERTFAGARKPVSVSTPPEHAAAA